MRRMWLGREIFVAGLSPLCPTFSFYPLQPSSSILSNLLLLYPSNFILLLPSPPIFADYLIFICIFLFLNLLIFVNVLFKCRICIKTGQHNTYPCLWLVGNKSSCLLSLVHCSPYWILQRWVGAEILEFLSFSTKCSSIPA